MAYIDQYGVRFSDDKKVLEKCPKDFQGAYKIPNSVTEIKTNAFRDCTGLTSIEIPNSVTEIGIFAFEGCTGLTSIEIPNSVTKIGSYAFSSCFGLTSIEIPSSVTEIGECAFNCCFGLKQIIVPQGQKVRFVQMKGLKEFEDKIVECQELIVSNKTSDNNQSATVLLNLAKAYEKGIGVSQDKGQAFMFYKQAAEAGSKEAQQWMQERELEE